ncbi:MAG: hypothetical protein IPM52_04440 [Bacteroidetes bacterium]|nr:hypothetical protein [Bacteroidota bacterium]
MKNVIFLTGVLLCLASKTFAQTETQNNGIASVFGSGKTEIQWSGLLTLNYHQKISNVKPGIAIEATINKHFVVGAFGQFTTGNFAMPFKGYQNNIITQDFGIIIGATQSTDKLFHFGGQLKVGAILMQADSTAEIKLSHPFTPTAKDNGITIYPEINANLNLTKHLKLRASTGFNFLMLNKETVVNERDLDTWFLNMALIFNFNK